MWKVRYRLLWKFISVVNERLSLVCFCLFVGWAMSLISLFVRWMLRLVMLVLCLLFRTNEILTRLLTFFLFDWYSCSLHLHRTGILLRTNHVEVICIVTHNFYVTVLICFMLILNFLPLLFSLPFKLLIKGFMLLLLSVRKTHPSLSISLNYLSTHSKVFSHLVLGYTL